MSEIIELDLSRSCIQLEEIRAYNHILEVAEARLESGKDPFTAWFKLPYNYDREEVETIKEVAASVRKECSVFVVIGIGGSYLGARAALSFIGEKPNCPKILFAGHNISGTYHQQLLNEIENEEICLCVISKSGTTTETSIAFALLKDLLYRKYGREDARKRIYTITDKTEGTLRKETIQEGYVSFVVPNDIGGRYSVLTAVGLFPLAVAGIDIDEILAGAAQEVPEKVKEYAAVRNALLTKGKLIEVFESYEPRLEWFCQWLKQLFGESEGKDGKGIFPTSLQFSTDLHSMGQYLQEGSPILFETVLNIKNPPADITIPESAGSLLAGRQMNYINNAALEGVIRAHEKAGVPIIRIDIAAMEERYFGQMVQFFERSCALSGYILGVNPFDQPGVEQYKAEMRKLLEE
ncbi:MAG: glucose-6-phosphate isomerase [Anaerovoracaceae bacterium]